MQEVPETILAYDQVLTNQIHDALGVLQTERVLLMEKVTEIDVAIKRYERALKALEPEAPKIINTAQKRSKKQRTAALQSLARSPQWIILRNDIITYAHVHDEFTQAEFRKGYDIASGKASLAFELLRQENVLRLSRVNGNFKFFRLTQEAIDAAK